LSLSLTLLEYVNPPDLTETRFQLPALRDRNIFRANAFDDESPWYRYGCKRPFDWIVGNPPWKELKPGQLDEPDEVAWSWITRNRKEYPVGGNQLAEAFAWRSSEVLARDGIAALLLPAMTLFKYESTAFRKCFFRKMRLWNIANFANLSDVLFSGRATLPAASFLYSRNGGLSVGQLDENSIEVYSPFRGNQPASQGENERRRKQTWNIVINASDLREIQYRDIIDGNSLIWKISLWGSQIDVTVLKKLEKRFRSIGDLEQDGIIVIAQGPELRSPEHPKRDATERHTELAGRPTVDLDRLKGRRYLIRFPREALRRIQISETFVRKRGGISLPLSVCKPPHVIMGNSRKFAVYTESFLVVPPRQTGISALTGDKAILKALALYLNSDFVAYHQFLTSSEAGIQKSISTKKALRSLPVPFEDHAVLKNWERLYSRLESKTVGKDDFDDEEWVREINDLTYESLRFDSRARAAVHDLVHVRFAFTRGKGGSDAVREPSIAELEAYARTLRDDLDSFVGESSSNRHRINLLFGGGSGLVAVEIVPDTKVHQPIHVLRSDHRAANELRITRSMLTEHRSQWLYFNRNLRIYDASRTYILKPLQRLNWTQTQAMQDAGEILSDCIQPPPKSARAIV